uniref:Uncharacterized protein n=1 Tax=viral metagenome TaxID=1070528 RepID=A0A6C0D0B8_9ZZZZ
MVNEKKSYDKESNYPSEKMNQSINQNEEKNKGL